MSDDESIAGSVTEGIARLRAGDRDAAQTIWDHYYSRLVALARGRLRRPGGIEGEEVAAASAIDSMCVRLMDGRCAGISDRENLWRLLVEITRCKAIDQIERRNRIRSGGGHVFEDAEFTRFVGQDPTADFVCEAIEQFNKLMSALEAPELKRIATMKMEGHTRKEIGRELGCHERSVANKLQLIRMIWVDAGLATPDGSLPG